MYEVLLSISRTDINLVIQKLREMYIDRLKTLQYTLYGEPIRNPYPIVKISGRKIVGFPIKADKIKYLEPISHRKKILAVDASIKTLFNIGGSRIVISKVTAGIWRGITKIYSYGPVKRISLVLSKEEAGEWLLRLEIEAALKLAHKLGLNDYCLLDRSLSISPLLKKSTREIFVKLDKTVQARGGILVGLTKSSRLKLNTGESLVGYIIRQANKRLRGVAWYYYPIFKSYTLPKWFLGDIAVAKLGDDSKCAFRIDVSKRALVSRNMEAILGELAFVQDLATPGYPYPLKAVHLESRINESELEIDRMLFLEVLKREGLYEEFMSNLHGTDFKERHLWS